MLNTRKSTLKATKVGILIGVMALLGPQLATATITFNQLDDDIFVVSHRVKAFGSRGQAMRMVYEKAASLCVAAGYQQLEIMDQESQAWQEEETANASIRVRFFLEDGEGRIACRKTASAPYVEQAAVKLRKRGYQPPAPAANTAAEAADETSSCSSEQISAMVKLRLSAEQIDAACGEENGAPPSRLANVPAH